MAFYVLVLLVSVGVGEHGPPLPAISCASCLPGAGKTEAQTDVAQIICFDPQTNSQCMLKQHHCLLG